MGAFPMAPLSVVHLLPELESGGVEDHVVALANRQVQDGMSVAVCSNGGRLERRLRPEISAIHLPIHRKNIAVGLRCAASLAKQAKTAGWQLFHAHSRVPAWVAYLASKMSGLPWVATVHAAYSKNAGLWPYRRAGGAICVSQAMASWMEGRLPKRVAVIYNGIDVSGSWEWKNRDRRRNLLFLGRLTKLKGLETLLEGLAGLSQYDWKLDVAGEGPQSSALKDLVRRLNLDGRVSFLGFRNDTERLLSLCDLLVAPSLSEGMGLSVALAARLGTPILASDIPAFRELSRPEGYLVPAGNCEAWRQALEDYFKGAGKISLFSEKSFRTVEQMTDDVSSFYRSIVS